MVQKWDACPDGGLALAIEVERNANARFFGLAFDFCPAVFHWRGIKAKKPAELKRKNEIPVSPGQLLKLVTGLAPCGTSERLKFLNLNHLCAFGSNRPNSLRAANQRENTLLWPVNCCFSRG